MSLAVVILAAGKSTRMKSALTKVLHPVAGRPLITYPLAAAKVLRPDRIALVVGQGQRAEIEPALNGTRVRWVIQREQLGTGHAVLASYPALRGFSGPVLILAGDVPGLQSATLKDFVATCAASGAPGGVLTVEMADPTGYGRIVRNGTPHISHIVEERDLPPSAVTIREVNTGILCCESAWLFRALKKIERQNTQQEYYLTDLAKVAAEEGHPLIAIKTEDAAACQGVNSRAELAEVNRLMRRRIVEQWMDAGVGFVDPGQVYIDADVVIGEDTVIGPGVMLKGRTQIGARCRIDAGAVIMDSAVADDVVIKPYSVIEGSQIGVACQVGPFARLRPETRLEADVRIGNFVETKKSVLKKGAKANHLTYLGDATIGERTNVGCGTITCNYDGKKKHPTIIGEDVFIGSDTQFVAPVRIGKGAVTGAGSVITDDVPAGALAVARGRQVNVKNWAKKRKR
ncbi:MAG: bifunctional UDP-N-acetylglucosamine diphosphorylase/glucosamine-1-phosphate N-acetyltransferase GlmU [Deltaproteobacteria bacterium]|nr:bifunctional UDP-N-acetylglucosamine diphosphorylase/glucosamine-1-phosphate N-acetyltransferase GlmU [Deltaproteobacteria bacterium]